MYLWRTFHNMPYSSVTTWGIEFERDGRTSNVVIKYWKVIVEGEVVVNRRSQMANF